MNKEKGTRSNREMLRAYLDLNGGMFIVDEVNDTKFHVVDRTIPYDQCGFDLEVKSGRVTCNGTDCIENMKSAFDGDTHMLEKIEAFEDKYYGPNEAGLEFDWSCFTKKDLRRMNKQKHSDGYGCIQVSQDNGTRYIVDVTWETKASCDRDGICLDLYEMTEDGCHGDCIDNIQSIDTAADYRHFVARAEKAVAKSLKQNGWI